MVCITHNTTDFCTVPLSILETYRSSISSRVDIFKFSFSFDFSTITFGFRLRSSAAPSSVQAVRKYSCPGRFNIQIRERCSVTCNLDAVIERSDILRLKCRWFQRFVISSSYHDELDIKWKIGFRKDTLKKKINKKVLRVCVSRVLLLI